MKTSLIGPRFSRDLPPYRTLLAVDLERFSGNKSHDLPWYADAVPRVLKEAFRRSKIDWSCRRFPQATGDGFVLGLPPEMTPRLLHPFLGELQKALAAESAKLPDGVSSLRMRVSIHLGALPDTGGKRNGDGVGKPMNDAHRLLDCTPLRNALKLTDPKITFVAAIISGRIFTDVVEAGYTALKPGELIPVHAEVKQFSEDAWIYVPTLSGTALRNGFGMEHSGVERAIPKPAATPTSPEIHPVPATELGAARTWYVPPSGAARARETLHNRHLVVLLADPGGRRTAALHLLDELATQNGIEVMDVVKRWARPTVAALPLHTGCGYLLNLNDECCDRTDATFIEDLRIHASQLVDHGSYLVITARPALWREYGSDGLSAVKLGRPDPKDVLGIHLARLGAESPDDSIAAELPPGISPAEVAEWAELYASGFSQESLKPSTELLDREFLRLTDPGGDESVYLLRDGQRPRALVSFGREVPGEPPPDIVLDSGRGSWVSRNHGHFEYADGQWWLVPCGENKPSIRRRGELDPEPTRESCRLRDGDVIQISLKPAEDGTPRRWNIEFRDPQLTMDHPAHRGTRR